MKNSISLLVILSLVFWSCVPAKKYQDLKAKNEQCQKELAQFQSENEKFKNLNTELEQKLESSKKELQVFEEDLADAKRKFNEKEQQYDKLKSLHDDILLRYDRLLANSSKENSSLSSKLDKTQKELQEKEDELNKLEKDLKVLEKNLNQLKTDLENKQNALELREQRVKELEELIAKKDAAVNALKEKVSGALLAFQNKGLTVEQKNGKVYVSLEAKLLFASGSTTVGTQGKVAVIQLAKALEGENELEIVVEGHTDSDALKSSNHPKNNWELSVLRATSVVEIMTANSTINPKILTAAGRSQYNPAGEDKAANRRIEVILTPNLDKLYDIISK